jgi:hypothetical protein
MLLAFISIHFNREDEYCNMIRGVESYILEPRGSAADRKTAGQQSANAIHAAIRFKVIEARAVIDKA